MKDGHVNSTDLTLISLYEISKILGSSFDVESTVRDVLNLLSAYLEMRRGVFALEDETGELRVVAAANMSRQAARNGAAHLPPDLARRIMATGMPDVDHSADRDSWDGQGRNEDRGEHICVSFVAVPVKVIGEPCGVLGVERLWTVESGVNFAADIRFLAMVANLIGQQLRLHRDVAADRERLMEEAHRRQKAMEVPQPMRLNGQATEILGTSEAMRRVLGQVEQVAPTRSTVLLRGESGTGKELIARALHRHSRRHDKPFVKLNCAALPESLLETELFGHDKGAFTGSIGERKGRFEMADGGTLFLDEIGEISRPFQAKLLRVLQEGEFERVGGSRTIKADVRIIAATNRNLEEAVLSGEFRGDLYYRINVVPIFVPPLRERTEDIPILAVSFLERFNKENERNLRFSEHAIRVLRNCHFPGNVRELENCVNRVATLAQDELIVDLNLPCQTGQCLSQVLWKNGLPTAPAVCTSVPDGMTLPGMAGPGRPAEPHRPGPSPAAAAAAAAAAAGQTAGVPAPPPPPAETAYDETDLPQRERLIRAMNKAGWVQAKAARLLNLTPRQLSYALRKYNIEIKRL